MHAHARTRASARASSHSLLCVHARRRTGTPGLCMCAPRGDGASYYLRSLNCKTTTFAQAVGGVPLISIGTRTNRQAKPAIHPPHPSMHLHDTHALARSLAHRSRDACTRAHRGVRARATGQRALSSACMLDVGCCTLDVAHCARGASGRSTLCRSVSSDSPRDVRCIGWRRGGTSRPHSRSHRVKPWTCSVLRSAAFAQLERFCFAVLGQSSANPRPTAQPHRPCVQSSSAAAQRRPASLLHRTCPGPTLRSGGKLHR